MISIYLSIYLSFFGSFQPRRSSAGWKRSCCGASANACDAWPRRQKIFVEDESPPESWWMNRDEYSMMIGMNWVVVCFFFFIVIGIFLCDELGCYCGILGINWDVHLLGFIGTNTKWWLGIYLGLIGIKFLSPFIFSEKNPETMVDQSSMKSHIGTIQWSCLIYFNVEGMEISTNWNKK